MPTRRHESLAVILWVSTLSHITSRERKPSEFMV